MYSHVIPVFINNAINLVSYCMNKLWEKLESGVWNRNLFATEYLKKYWI